VLIFLLYTDIFGGDIWSVDYLQVPENMAANALAEAIVEAWFLYGNPKLVH